MLLAVGSLAAAIAATGGFEALRTWFFVNHVERFVHPVATGHQRPLAYYVWTLPTAIAPWLVPFLALFYVPLPLWKRDRPDAAIVRFALAMVAGPLFVLSLSSSKREVYLLPLLPPLALLMASALGDRIDAGERSTTLSLWTRAGDWVQAAILGLCGLAPAVAYVAFTKQVAPASAALGLLGLGTALVLVLQVARGNARRAFWAGAASLGVAIAGAFALVVPQFDAIKDLQPFVRSIDGMLPRGEPVVALGADETLLGIVPFVTGRRVIPVEPAQLAEAEFVLVQSVEKEPVAASLESDYERVALREFGPSRRMALWRRRLTRP
jgi:4-amino-4-deoxy-L-arabinose transferase-like glycosyltransferase